MSVDKITSAPTANEVIAKINEIIDNLGGGGGSSTNLLYSFVNNVGTTLDTELSLTGVPLIFRNGVLLTATTDYTISGSVITFVVALVATDIINVLNNASSIVGDYVPVPTVVTDGDNTDLAIAANTIYKFTNALSTLTLSSAEVSDYESVIYFYTGTSIAFFDNAKLKWQGDGAAPSLEINTMYRISIHNGFADINSYGDAPLPSRYNEVDYLVGAGAQYFDTGLTATSGFKIKTKISADSGSPYNWRIICGSHNLSSPYQRNFIGIPDTSRATSISVAQGNGDKWTSNNTLTANTWYEIEASNIWNYTYVKINGTNATLSSVDTPSNSYSSRNLYMFANNNVSSGASQYFYGKIRTTQIWVNDSLVRYYVPCYDTQTSKYGMYDLVERTFNESAGTAFTGGNI